MRRDEMRRDGGIRIPRVRAPAHISESKQKSTSMLSTVRHLEGLGLGTVHVSYLPTNVRTQVSFLKLETLDYIQSRGSLKLECVNWVYLQLGGHYLGVEALVVGTILT